MSYLQLHNLTTSDEGHSSGELVITYPGDNPSEVLYRTKQHSLADDPGHRNPATELSTALTTAYDFFNARFFQGALPCCVLIVNRRSKRTYGYFIGDFWEDCQEQCLTHEVSLNPDYFHTRPLSEVLSTLVHEQCHLWQHVDPDGKAGRGGYHNKQFARKMESVGLICSDTGQPGGKKTGQPMAHYIEPGGVFERFCQELLDTGFVIPWHTVTCRNAHDNDDDDLAKKKRASKTKYSCPGCALNAWAKSGVVILCGRCQQELVEAIS